MNEDIIKEQFLTMDFKSFVGCMLCEEYYDFHLSDLTYCVDADSVRLYIKNFTHNFDVTPTKHVLKWLEDLEFLNEATKKYVGKVYPQISLLEYAKSICKPYDSSHIAERNPFCFLDCKTPRTWENGRYGFFVPDANQYVFVEYIMNDFSHSEKSTPFDSIVADMFVGYWLQHRNGNTRETFDNYFQVALNHYIDTHQSESDAWCRDLDAEFIEKHIDMENQAFADCEILEMLTEPERNIVRRYYDSYQEWFKLLRSGIKKRHKSRSGINIPTRCDLTKYKDYIDSVFKWFKDNSGVIPQDFTFDDFMDCCNNADFGRVWNVPNQRKELTRLLIVKIEEKLNLGMEWRNSCAESIGENNQYLTKNKNKAERTATRFPIKITI